MRQSFSRDLVKPDGESSGIGNSGIGGNPLGNSGIGGNIPGNSDIGKLLFASRDVASQDVASQDVASRDVASRGGQLTGGQLTDGQVTGGQVTGGQVTDGQGRIPPSSALPFRTTLEALRADNGFTSAGAPLTARSGNGVPGGKCCRSGNNVPGGKCCGGGKCCRSGNNVPGGKCCRSGNNVPGGDDGNRVRLAAEHLARRLRLPVPLILPNLREIDGRLVCSGPFLVAILNACGRFSPLRFELLDGQDGRDGHRTRGGARRQGDEAVRSRRRTSSAGDGRYPACRAVATDRRTGETLATPPVPLSGPLSDLMSGPEQGGDLPPEALPHYRAAALFGDLYAPELLMGIRCAETPDVPPIAGQTSPAPHGETTGTPKTPETTSGEAAKTPETVGKTAEKAEKSASKTAEKATKTSANTSGKATKTAGKAAKTASKTAEKSAKTAETAAGKSEKTTNKSSKTSDGTSEASSTASATAGTSSTASGVVAPCGVASLDDPVFPCPRKGGGLVSDDDCFYCTSRKRCDRNGRYGRK